MLFCCKISLLCDLRCFVVNTDLLRFTRFGVEQIWAKNFVCGEKRTNIRYGLSKNIAHVWSILTFYFRAKIHLLRGEGWEGGGGAKNLLQILPTYSHPTIDYNSY